MSKEMAQAKYMATHEANIRANKELLEEVRQTLDRWHVTTPMRSGVSADAVCALFNLSVHLEIEIDEHEYQLEQLKLPWSD